jgi:hypothetical protein
MEIIVDEEHVVEQNVDNIWRDLPAGTPFRNAIAKFRQIFRAQLKPLAERAAALQAIEPYKGRGKNHNYPFIKRLESKQVKPSKHEPHQGARECERRASQSYRRRYASLFA